MKLALRRRSKTERAIDATSDLAKLWAGAKLTKGTARAARKAARLKAVGSKRSGRRAMAGKAVAGSKTGRRAAIGKAVASSDTGRSAGRKLLGAALAGKAAKGAAKGAGKRRSGEGRRRSGQGRGRKLLVLGGTAGAVAIALKARKGKSDEQEATWTPPEVPVGGATVAGDTTPTTVAGDVPTPVTVPPGPTSVAPTPAGLPDDAPNVGATGFAPEAADEEADRS
ncbi:MAG TPA: hypothetical protein VGW11_10860 [Solirubrobacteraceae bacterium]|nr:hypothetical protein [Solirubrobacteraceae bacterium]